MTTPADPPSKPFPPAYLTIPNSEPSSEWSYGLIPLRFVPSSLASNSASNPPTTRNTQVLLIKQRPHPATGHPPFWSFPKGHPEEGDASPLETAIREVSEETGLEVREEDVMFRESGGLIERYRNPLKLWVKEVRYWVALVHNSNVKLQEMEVAASKWCDWEEAEAMVTFERGRGILKRVRELLDGEGEKL